MPCRAALVLALLGGLAACAPTNTNTTYSAGEIGRAATMSTGVIMSMRPVTVQAQNTGIGAVSGAVVGGTAGSFIGRNNVAANVMGAVGGAVVGGLVGNAVEGGLGTGSAIEFIIRQDNGQAISVVQTNEEAFRPGDRVVITFGARTRIAHAY